MAAAARATRFGDLRLRILSAAVLAPLALLLLWLGGLWAAGLIAAIAACMAWEIRAIVAARGGPTGVEGGIAAATGAGAVLLSDTAAPLAGLAVLAIGVALLAGRDIAARRLQVALWSAGGIALVTIAAMSLRALRDFEPFGFLSAFWVILVVVAADTGGYFAGRLIGGPKLWPAVSPKKTWSGLLGGVALAFFGGGMFSWATTGTYFYEVCTVSGIAALVSVGGDLAESALKRRFGVKDSGRLLPGHGGALDRFDGLMAATLVASVVTFWRGKTVFIW